MTNHYHIVIETAEPNLSRGMRYLNGVYTQKFNYRHKRVGHLYQGRFKSIIVDKDNYLLEVCRYTVLNPVRAGMIKDSEEYNWSSYNTTAGKIPSPPWLDIDSLLLCFGNKRIQAIKAYILFISEGIGKTSLWSNLTSQVCLGSQDFINTMQEKTEQEELSEEIPKLQRLSSVPVQTLESFKEQFPKKEAMAKAYLSGHYTQKTIADFFGVHYATVSRAIHMSQKDGI